MIRRTVLNVFLFAGLLIWIWWAIRFTCVDASRESVSISLSPERVPVRSLNAAGQAKRENDAPLAHTWAVAKSPVSYTLTSVDMVSATDGWSVGYWGRDGLGYPVGETILRWDGIGWYEWYSWSNDPALFSVEMGASDDGWTVGRSDEILRWEGNDWNTVSSPTYKQLESVAMVSQDDGWIVGWNGSCYNVGTGINATILHWDGNEWSTWADPISDIQLFDVDMVSASDGWAVGNYCHFTGTPPPSQRSVIMRWNGSNWSSVSLPMIWQFYQTLYAVDMLSATDGWAVGTRGVTLHWNGSEWSAVSSPTEVTLYSVSAVSTNDVWAVGGGYQSPTGTIPVILNWNGSVWSKVQVPSPIAEDLNSVSMISSEEGWAVGEAGTILHYTSEDKLLRAVGAATADYDWNWKSEFDPGDPIRYIIIIVNETGGDAEIELTYAARGPNNEPVFDDQWTDTIPPGIWQWGDDWTVPEGMSGVHTLTVSGLYMGTTTQAVVTYTVTGAANYKIYLPLARK